MRDNQEALTALEKLQKEIVSCQACPRLREHCSLVAQIKRRAYLDWDYWGKPVPSFGDPKARVLLLGLAPGAHGANRTGRMFTGDASGDFLFRVLHKTGFASQPESNSRNDGLHLVDAYITAAGRCAPPDNKPERVELERCRPYLERELQLLENVEVIVALGRIAFDTYLAILGGQGKRPAKLRFEHGLLHNLAPKLICSYHPSQQNTSTGRLTEQMFTEVFVQARSLLSPGQP